MKYKSLLNSNKITKHQTSKQEILELLGVAERDIKDSQLEHLSEDRSFATAYNAALQLCKIILAVEGYRTRGTGHHRTTFDFVEMSDIKGFNKFVIYFNKCRRKRNDIDYDRVFVVSSKENKEIIKNVVSFKDVLLIWLKEKKII